MCHDMAGMAWRRWSRVGVRSTLERTLRYCKPGATTVARILRTSLNLLKMNPIIDERPVMALRL